MLRALGSIPGTGDICPAGTKFIHLLKYNYVINEFSKADSCIVKRLASY